LDHRVTVTSGRRFLAQVVQLGRQGTYAFNVTESAISDPCQLVFETTTGVLQTNQPDADITAINDTTDLEAGYFTLVLGPIRF
jgi:hypothetical protein